MTGLHDVVDSYNYYFCVFRQGFAFTSIDSPVNVLDAIVIRNPEQCNCWSPKKSFSECSLEEHIKLINEYQLEKACIIAEDISFITRCPSLKRIEIMPADSAPDNFDYSPLYDMPSIEFLLCKTAYGGSNEPKSTTIDYSQISGLKEINISGKGNLNCNRAEMLEIINVGQDKWNKNLTAFSNLHKLKQLELVQCGITSLQGVETLSDLQELALYNCRSLRDVSAVSSISKSLRALHIENCSAIKDFSCLQELKELECLCLLGSNTLPDLNFLNNMKQLQFFSLSMVVQDGDLVPCLKIPYVHLLKGKKHYNLKDKDLPKKRPAHPLG